MCSPIQLLSDCFASHPGGSRTTHSEIGYDPALDLRTGARLKLLIIVIIEVAIFDIIIVFRKLDAIFCAGFLVLHYNY